MVTNDPTAQLISHIEPVPLIKPVDQTVESYLEDKNISDDDDIPEEPDNININDLIPKNLFIDWKDFFQKFQIFPKKNINPQNPKKRFSKFSTISFLILQNNNSNMIISDHESLIIVIFGFFMQTPLNYWRTFQPVIQYYI